MHGAYVMIHWPRRLNTWTQKQGTIRLSEDDGLSSVEFLSNDFDEDHQRIGDDDSLDVTVEPPRPADADTANSSAGTSADSEGNELSSDSPPVPLPEQ